MEGFTQDGGGVLPEGKRSVGNRHNGALCPGDSTQWEDIHRRLGNFAAKPKEQTVTEIEKLVVDAAERFDPMQDKSLKELDKLEDDVEEDELEKVRRKRMEEMRAKSKASKFGDVRHIRRDNFVQEVTESSANGQWVLLLLFIEGRSQCQHLMKHWEGAAKKFPTVKFLKGVADEVIPEFPEARTPAVLMYHNEDCRKQVIGIDEWGGRRCDIDCIEWVMSKEGIIDTELEDDPREASAQVWEHKKGKSQASGGYNTRRDESDEENSDEDREHFRADRCYASTRLQTLTQHRGL